MSTATSYRRLFDPTPFHPAAAVFLAAGLGLAVYHGMEQFGLVPGVAWTSWSHVHFVTIGGFTQLLVGTLPALTARRLDRPLPPRWYTWTNFLGLNAGFVLVWYGRGWGQTWAFDLGLAVIWLLVAGLLVVLVRMALRSNGRAWDATVGLSLVAVFVFLWGLTYAYGLFGHVWSVPGGWLGLREAHVHANAWGFLGLAAVGTLYELLPRIVGADLRGERLRDVSAWLLVAGIFPLMTGPWLGMGRSVTATGLVVYAAGFALYLVTLVRTYAAAPAPRPGLGLSVLTAQFWLLAPAAFAPVVLFGVEWVEPAFVEDAALHFLFVGWALPVALAGLALFLGGSRAAGGESPDAAGDVGPDPGSHGTGNIAPGTDRHLDRPVPSMLPGWAVGAWNLAVLAVGVGFLYQTEPWTAWLFGPGYAVVAALWGYQLVWAVRRRVPHPLSASSGSGR